MPVSRRKLFMVGGAAGTAAVLPYGASADAREHGSLRSFPFQLGVASGDPTHDGVVLWTRLALDPLADDGSGGIPDRVFPVHWQLAEDEHFTKIVDRGTKLATPLWGHSVHVELSGLESNREYFYRFRVGPFYSQTGRTKTAPAPDDMPDELRMVFVSCAQFEHGYFTAYRRLAEEKPDLILHLGDYIYEYRKGVYLSPDGNVRDHVGPETETLANYRQRHAQYKTDSDLQAAHAAAPWVSVFDDHEVDNNWADMAPEQPVIGFAERREAAFRAYYENTPLRKASKPDGLDLQLYRRLHWGRLATFHMLDTRQYRDDQACGDGWHDWKGCTERFDPKRSIMGADQEEWLIDGFHESTARWDILGQQVFFAERLRAEGGPTTFASTDGWDGYVASRDRITSGWVSADVRNPVVLTGDVHTHWACELKSDYDEPDAPSVGVELITSSITSGGNGLDGDPKDNPMLGTNPHIKFYNQQRGYVSTRITPDSMEVDFKVVPIVTFPWMPVYTRASYVIEDGDSTLHETYMRPVDPEDAGTYGEQSMEELFEAEDGEDLAGE